MIEDLPDLYETPSPIAPIGENLLSFGADGSLEVSRKLPSDKITRKDAKAVRECGDESIAQLAENTLGTYYVIGKKVSVSRRTSGGWLCGTCSGPDRYEMGDHRGCCHIARVKRYVAEHPQVEAA